MEGIHSLHQDMRNSLFNILALSSFKHSPISCFRNLPCSFTLGLTLMAPLYFLTKSLYSHILHIQKIQLRDKMFLHCVCGDEDVAQKTSNLFQVSSITFMPYIKVPIPFA